jgi:lipoprotein NlpD
MFYLKQSSKWFLSALTISVLAACSTISKSPSDSNVTDAVVVKQPLPPLSYPYYRVKTGDTLYSIAMRNDKDYKELGRLNKLDEKYTIYVDQKLVLEDENAPTTKTQAIENTKITAKPLASTKPATTASNTTVKKPTETVTKSTPSVGTNVQDTVKNGSLTWSWPMTGSLLKRFSTEGVGSKGIDIAGKRGDIVKAAADGVVVYAGEGLVGYGKLLIVRHNDEYITAYAHNDRLIATEGQKLKLGQTIAEVGSTGTDKDKLHFEIRYKGKPIDPLTILPK